MGSGFYAACQWHVLAYSLASRTPATFSHSLRRKCSHPTSTSLSSPNLSYLSTRRRRHQRAMYINVLVKECALRSHLCVLASPLPPVSQGKTVRTSKCPLSLVHNANKTLCDRREGPQICHLLLLIFFNFVFKNVRTFVQSSCHYASVILPVLCTRYTASKSTFCTE
jgi:hypothetical protein